MRDRRTIALIAGGFFLSTAFTLAFIVRYDHYPSPAIMVLSGTIASAKWLIQIVVGYINLREKRWIYIRQLASTCLTGSTVLLPFAFFGGSAGFFFGSLVAAILIMAVDIFRRLTLSRFPIKWFLLWLGLLGVAVTLQVTVVFHIV